MKSLDLAQASFLMAEMALIAILLLAYYRAREQFGMATLYLSLGAFLSLQNLLAAVLPLNLGAGIKINPGSAVLFPANLLIVLLLYIRKEAIDLKRFCVVVTLINMSISLIIYSMYKLHIDHIQDPSKQLIFRKIFSGESARSSFVASLVMVADIFLVIVVFGKLRRKHLTWRMFISLSVALGFDSIFYTIVKSYFNNEPFSENFYGQIAFKLLACVLYSLIVSCYIYRFEKDQISNSAQSRGLTKVLLSFLMFRKPYTDLRPLIVLDNDMMFHIDLRESLSNLLKEARRSAGMSITLIILEIPKYDSMTRDQHSIIRDILDTRLNRRLGATCLPAFICSQRRGQIALVILQNVSSELVEIAIKDLINSRVQVETHWQMSDHQLELVVGSHSFDPAAEDGTTSLRMIHEATKDLEHRKYERTIHITDANISPIDASVHTQSEPVLLCEFVDMDDTGQPVFWVEIDEETQVKACIEVGVKQDELIKAGLYYWSPSENTLVKANLHSTNNKLQQDWMDGFDDLEASFHEELNKLQGVEESKSQASESSKYETIKEPNLGFQ